MLNLLILCLFTQSSQAFRALYLANNIGYSHLEYTGKLADVLVDAGHEVDFVVEIWDQNLNYNGSKKANIIKFVGKNMDRLEEVNKKMTMRNEAFDGDWDTKEWKMFGKYMGTHCDALLSDHQFLNYLRTRNYTVGLSEVFDGCSWAVFKLLGIKSTHETSAFTIREPTGFAHGIQPNFRHVPAMTSYNRIGPVKTYFDLFYNFYEYLLNRFYILNLECGPTNEVIKQHLGQDHPTMAEMQRHSSFVWLNTYEIMDFTRLNTPKIKHIGGIAVNKNPGKLNEQTEKIFKQAKSGVVLISFGSLVNTAYMKTEVRRQLLEAFARYPDYQFIWRLTEINDEILADIKNYTNNVHAFKWVQQTSILADSRTVAFLTHVGVNSLNEAVYYGVPLIAVPDQMFNSAMVQNRGNGVVVPKRELDKMPQALEEVLHNKKYRERSLDLSKKVRNLPFKQEELFVKHVEFSEQVDISEDFILDAVNETFIENFNLDIIASVAFILIVFGYLTTKLLKYSFNLVVLAFTLFRNNLFRNNLLVSLKAKKID